MDKPNSTSSGPERRTKPISQREKELTEALDFLVSNLQLHSEEYHHKTDSRKVKRCEEILEDAISELIARKERTSRFSHMELNGKLFSSKENCYQIESGLEC